MIYIERTRMGRFVAILTKILWLIIKQLNVRTWEFPINTDTITVVCCDDGNWVGAEYDGMK